MNSSVLDSILEFRELLIVGIAVGVIFFLVFSYLAGNITWKSRSTRFFGIFLGLNIRDLLWLSVGAVRIIFVFCVCVFTQRLAIEHTAFYVALVLLSVITFFGFPRILIELINAVAVYASLTVLGILIGYFRDVNNNPMIFLIYVLLSLFTVLYSVYFYMKGVSDLVINKLGPEQWKVIKK